MSLIHRQAAVAGQFYPIEAMALSSEIEYYLNNASNLEVHHPKAIIAPHAGYIYSGAIAASGYTQLQNRSTSITNIIILGPAHRVAFNGIATSSARYFDTPLGSVELNQSLIKKLSDLHFIQCHDEAHRNEHSIEVQLPFLQSILGKFTIVPLLIGDCDSNDVSTVLNLLWGGSETFIIISSDLSHFHSYDTATKNDDLTSQAILKLQPEKIHYSDACGRTPINGLLKIAQTKKLKASILDVRNSGDTAGDKTRVVGYGAYSFTEQPS